MFLVPPLQWLYQLMSSSTNYTKLLIIFTYAFTGLCGAGLQKVSLLGMAFIFCACVVQGLVMTNNESWHLYLRRLTGSLLPALTIILFYRFLPFVETPYQLMSAMIMPIASGTTLVEGLCHTGSSSGRKMILDAILVALCLEIGAFLAITLGGLVGWL